MRPNVHDTKANWFHATPSAVIGDGAMYGYHQSFAMCSSKRACARATVLASLILAGIAGLVITGLATVVGIVGLGIWYLWG